jgi:hypothetical protein
MRVNSTTQLIFFFALLFSTFMATFSLYTMIQEATAQETDVLGIPSKFIPPEKYKPAPYVPRDPSTIPAKKGEEAILFGDASYKSPVVVKGGFPTFDGVERSSHELTIPDAHVFLFTWGTFIVSFLILFSLKFGIHRIVYIIQIDDVYNPRAKFNQRHGPFSKRAALNWLAREGIDTDCMQIDIMFYTNSTERDGKMWVGRDNISNYYITK